MTARLPGGFDTRADLGLRSALSISHDITPSVGGVAGHYGGGTLGITATSSHEACRRVWRGWQNYHMDGHGWVDIAYTGGFCQHGYALAGRGFGVRTAANGTDDANQRFYAVVFVGGGSDVPTAAALDAFDWWVNEARTKGAAGKAVPTHGDLYSTECGGQYVRARCRVLDGKAIPSGPTPTPVKPTPQPVRPIPKPSGPVILEKGVKAPAFPLPAGRYFGPEGGPAYSVSGYHGHGADLARWQARMIHRGYNLGAAGADGRYGSPGDTEPDGFTARAAAAGQKSWGIDVDSLIGPDTWRRAWTENITRP